MLAKKTTIIVSKKVGKAWVFAPQPDITLWEHVCISDFYRSLHARDIAVEIEQLGAECLRHFKVIDLPAVPMQPISAYSVTT